MCVIGRLLCSLSRAGWVRARMRRRTLRHLDTSPSACPVRFPPSLPINSQNLANNGIISHGSRRHLPPPIPPPARCKGRIWDRSPGGCPSSVKKRREGGCTYIREQERGYSCREEGDTFTGVFKAWRMLCGETRMYV